MAAMIHVQYTGSGGRGKRQQPALPLPPPIVRENIIQSSPFPALCIETDSGHPSAPISSFFWGGVSVSWQFHHRFATGDGSRNGSVARKGAFLDLLSTLRFIRRKRRSFPAAQREGGGGGGSGSGFMFLRVKFG